MNEKQSSCEAGDQIEPPGACAAQIRAAASCEVCGTAIEGRSDRRTCSNACRKRAARLRKTASGRTVYARAIADALRPLEADSIEDAVVVEGNGLALPAPVG